MHAHYILGPKGETMALSPEIKSAIKAELRLGKTPKELEEKYECNISAIYSLNRQVKAEAEDEVVQELLEVPIEVLTHVVKEAKKDLPLPTPTRSGAIDVADQLDAVVVGIDGLKKLDGKFQSTMTKVLQRFDEVLEKKDLRIQDIKMVSDTVADAYSKVFASGTNIHIGDNNVSSQRLTVFKTKMGV